MNDSLTPMMQQYRELKARDPEALLLFRMGDFYEMFGDDAERASELLGLAVATRDRDKGPNATKMAGFPHPALEAYLKKLVQLGVRVAVCEQVEDPRFAKGVVKRDIVRVVTPGTLTDDELLDPKTANYLAAVVEVGCKLGLAWVELSTGRFLLTSLMRTELIDEIAGEPVVACGYRCVSCEDALTLYRLHVLSGSAAQVRLAQLAFEQGQNQKAEWPSFMWYLSISECPRERRISVPPIPRIISWHRRYCRSPPYKESVSIWSQRLFSGRFVSSR